MNPQSIFIGLLNQRIQDSRIVFRMNGTRLSAGSGPTPSDPSNQLTVRVNTPRFFSRVLASGNLGMGEAYMNHEFEMESGTLSDFLLTLLKNRLDRHIQLSPISAIKVLWIRIVDNLRGKASNVQRHYDVGDDLFKAFLDSNLVYSCGYVKDTKDDVDQLQTNKMDRICRKLRLRPGDTLLDIGCGYGSLLIHAAKHYGISGRGVTLSHRHHEHGTARIADEGLTGRVEIQFGDFSSVSGQYDRVVSVGMLEHVARRRYDEYFRQVMKLLKADGIGLVHALGANAPTNRHDPFFQKYIFPNSNQPRLSEITGKLEKYGLAILDVENMIRHYGYTVQRWYQRFLENRGTLNSQRYDDMFLRMWEYYLACGVAAAFASDSALYQVLFAKDYAADMPLHRV